MDSIVASSVPDHLIEGHDDAAKATFAARIASLSAEAAKAAERAVLAARSKRVKFAVDRAPATKNDSYKFAQRRYLKLVYRKVQRRNQQYP